MRENVSFGNDDRNPAVKAIDFGAVIIILNSSGGKRELNTWGARSIGKFYGDCVAG